MVAREAGVSSATVSYVMSGRGGRTNNLGVSSETETRVREAAQLLGYFPNQSAQTMRTGRTGLIQLSLSMLSDPWSLAVADAVNRAGNDRGLTTMILADGDWFRVLRQQQRDAAFIDHVPDQPGMAEKLATLVDLGQHLVLFSDHLEADGFDVIRSAALPGCYLAVEHLLARHTRIGCLTTEAIFHSTTPSRYTPYAQSLAEAGLSPRPEWVSFYEGSQASAFTAALRLLSQPDRPTAIYATTDFAAIAAINAAQRLGLNVPEEVAVIGVGNTPDGETLTPRLSTVGPADFFARQAEIIVQRASGDAEEPPRVHEFPWFLFARESTGG